MIRKLIATALLTAAVAIPTTLTLSPAPTATEYVSIPPALVSDAMNERLSDMGYDDTTVAIPRTIAILACYTDTDCSVASGDPLPSSS